MNRTETPKVFYVWKGDIFEEEVFFKKERLILPGREAWSHGAYVSIFDNSGCNKYWGDPEKFAGWHNPVTHETQWVETVFHSREEAQKYILSNNMEAATRIVSDGENG